MPENPIVILTAVAIEARVIAKALALKPLSKSDGQPPSWADATNSIQLQPVGIGAKRLSQVSPQRKHCVILAGFAGALDPSLKIGEVILDDCPTAWRQGFAGRSGAIHCSQQMVSTAARKAELFQQTRALAVDMESHAVREWAGTSFISIRAISDTAHEDLNPAVLRFIDDLGNVRPLALSRELLQNPTLLRQLVKLRASAQHAGDRLGQAVRQLVNQIQKTTAEIVQE